MKGDGISDLAFAEIEPFSSYLFIHTKMENNGTFWDDMSFGVGADVLERGVFTETPMGEFRDGNNTGGTTPSSILGVAYLDESKSQYIRLNGKVDYDPDMEKSYLELYIDNRFPQQLYYGLGEINQKTPVLSQIGAKITVTEKLPQKAGTM